VATNFPASLDSLTNPTSSDSLNSPSHSAQHANVNDAVEALQVKVGADSSAVTSSLDYKVAQLEGRDTAGLVHISRTTIGSAVSSVTVSGAFSTDYDNYKILVSGGAGSVQNALYLLLGSTTTGYHWSLIYTNYTNSPLAVASATGSNFAYAGATTIDSLQAVIELQSPFLAENTFIQSNTIREDSGAGMCTGVLDDTTSYTAFTLGISSGTMTGGYIDVYGYAKA
jgi:hypothetical protein